MSDLRVKHHENANVPLHRSLEQWYKYFSSQNNHPDIAKWPNPRNWEGASWKLIAGWLWSDTRRFIDRCSQIRSELRQFGGLIQQQYGVSRGRQFRQLSYLAFSLGIPLKHYRGYQLFKPERWKLVDDFLYEQGALQRECIARTYPKEEETLRDKLKFALHCKAHSIPTPDVLAVFDRGKMIYPEAPDLNLPGEDLFVKELRGGQGRGIEKISYKGPDSWRFSESTGHLSKDELINRLISQSDRAEGVLVQPVVRNHDDWLAFTPGGLATARIVTGRGQKGEIIPIGASLRMPTGDAVKDNFSAGGIASSIDIESGQLGRAITAVPIEGRFEFDTHPDTGHQLSGGQILKWDDLLSFVSEVHSHFQSVFVGWDVSYTRNGFQVIEGNLHWGSRLLEAPSQQLISDSIYPYLYDVWMSEVIDADMK